MGKPNAIHTALPHYFIVWSEPAEVKHPSKRRKKERIFIPLVAASEKGRAQTNYIIYYIYWGCKEILSPSNFGLFKAIL